MHDGVFHVVGDHHGGQLVFAHDAVRQLEHLGRRRGVERRGVLVEQQQLRLLQGGHQQRQRLTLTAGEQADLRRHAILKPEAEGLEPLMIFLALGLRDAPAQGALFAAARGEGEVFLDLHVCGRAHHGVLKHAADVLCATKLRHGGHVHAVEDDAPVVHRPDARDGVKHGGFSGAVAADDGHEIARLQVQRQPVERPLFVDRAGVEGLGDMVQCQHITCLPSSDGGTSSWPAP